VDIVQSKRKYIADSNDIIADQASKTYSVLLAQPTDPIIAKLKFSACNSSCDIETADSSSVLMNDGAMSDEDAHFDDEVEEQPASSVQELPLIRTTLASLPPLLEVHYFLITWRGLVSYR
jgi:hypothetical protein